MSRIADTMFVGFAISPYHLPGRELELDSVDIKVITTRQFKQHPEYTPILHELEDLVREQLGVRYVFGFREWLRQLHVNRPAQSPNVRASRATSAGSAQHSSSMFVHCLYKIVHNVCFISQVTRTNTSSKHYKSGSRNPARPSPQYKPSID